MKKKASPFDKFIKQKSNAAIKEQFRQEKKKAQRERAEYIDKKRAELRIQHAEPQKQSPHITRPQSPDLMPLNKFISHAGVSGRREAAEIVKKGIVKVNGKIVTEPGHKISPKDEVVVNGKKIFLSKNLVYILLNKPKDFITTTDDPQGRKTVLDLIRRATDERVYPVGRLDRNTSGLLLLTNDG
jgi:23S rRNA pseudouridine2605 synthase